MQTHQKLHHAQQEALWHGAQQGKYGGLLIILDNSNTFRWSSPPDKSGSIVRSENSINLFIQLSDQFLEI